MRKSPPYTSSLDAMHEAERTLMHEECVIYHGQLENIQAEMTDERNGEVEYPAQDFWFHASAKQRALAFLRAIEKQKGKGQ